MKKIVKLSTFAGGAIEERFDSALRDVLSNIADLNTDPKKKRKIVMTVTITGNEQRSLSDVSVQVKTTLTPAKDVETSILLDWDGASITGAELKSGAVGQTFIDDEGDIADDRGGKIIQIEKAGNAVKFN